MRRQIAIAAALSAMLAGIAAVAPAQTAAPANPVRGGQLFLQCRACHTVAAGGANTVGPNLAGIMGAKAASRAGYAYSPALAKSGIVWTPATMDGFLKRPLTAVPGTKMGYAGVADPKHRADLIAYLGTLKAKK